MPRRSLKERLRSLFRRRPRPTPIPEPPDEPPEHPSLVPRRPRPSGSAGAVALELPPEQVDLDLRGRETD